MSYPQFIDYNEAVQDPGSAFTDPELQTGTVAETPLGLPLALSGGFALTYTVDSGSRKFAVRCFHRQVPEVQQRYSKISERLRSLASPYFVKFDFQSEGIRIRSKPYPIVKMDWVEGKTLGVYLDRAASNAAQITALRQAFVNLADFLERHGIAHGDIQNENVMVSEGALRLIDYDGMFVNGLPEGRGTEVGHKNFQHPGRGTKEFGPKVDRFSFIVLDVSLEALQVDASLHRRFREGGNAIIFKANDFANPSSSEVFRILNGTPALRESATKLAAVCGAPISNVPTLTDFIVGHNIPIPIQPPLAVPPRPVRATVYIGAYDVVDAKDFDAVMRRVGDKIELVGQIVSIKQGIGKRGRGRNRPYVFLNFGIWNKNSVKITIWSDGLGKLSTRPNEAWVGRWISITGLIEPPYEGKHYGRPYRNVGVTVTSDSQIIQIAEQDAKFRLGRSSAAGARTTNGETGKRSNDDILKEVLSGSRRRGVATGPGTGVAPPPPVAPPKSKNEQILQTLQTSSGGSTMAPPSRAPSQSAAPHQIRRADPQTPKGVSKYPSRPTFSPPSRSLLSIISIWIWIVAAIVILILLTRR